MRLVVSISQNPRSTMKLRMKSTTSWRSRMRSRDRSRLRSTYRYFQRRVSSTSVSSFT